jgi:hypothetical protein
MQCFPVKSLVHKVLGGGGVYAYIRYLNKGEELKQVGFGYSSFVFFCKSLRAEDSKPGNRVIMAEHTSNSIRTSNSILGILARRHSGQHI